MIKMNNNNNNNNMMIIIMIKYNITVNFLAHFFSFFPSLPIFLVWSSRQYVCLYFFYLWSKAWVSSLAFEDRPYEEEEQQDAGETGY